MRRLVPAAVLLGVLALTAPAAHARSYTGTLYVEHGDDVRHARDVVRDVLYTAGGRRFELAGRAHPRLSGSRVSVFGVARGRRLTPRGLTVHRRARLRAATRALVSGPDATAVVMLGFLDRAATVTPDDVRSAVFTGPTSANALFAEESFGQLGLTGRIRPDGDVFGPYTIPYTAGWSCAYSTWSSAARSAAQSAGVDLTGYRHVIYSFPAVPGCGWAGMAQVSGTTVWINGVNEAGLYVHELGHNLGLEHAQSESCTSAGVPVPLSATCSVDEYGDPFDPMGDPYTSAHNSGFSLGRLGVLAPSDTQTVTAGGSYELTAPESAQTGAKQIRIPRPGGDYLYLEARRNVGGVFDAFPLASPVANGVLARVAPDLSSSVNSRLVDAHPLTATFDDAAFGVGESFTDPASGATITVTGSSATGATVAVAFPAPDTTPPSAPGGLTASATTSSVGLTWTPASDDVGVTSYRVYRDGVLLATVSRTRYDDFSAVPGATYGYRVTAIDAAGNESDPSAAATAGLPPRDTTAPTVPSGLTATVTRRGVLLSWQPSTDDVGVVRYLVSRNGRLAGSVRRGTAVRDGGVRRGRTYTYAVAAVDAAGHRSAFSDAVSVTVGGGLRSRSR